MAKPPTITIRQRPAWYVYPLILLLSRLPHAVQLYVIGTRWFRDLVIEVKEGE